MASSIDQMIAGVKPPQVVSSFQQGYGFGQKIQENKKIINMRDLKNKRDSIKLNELERTTSPEYIATQAENAKEDRDRTIAYENARTEKINNEIEKQDKEGKLEDLKAYTSSAWEITSAALDKNEATTQGKSEANYARDIFNQNMQKLIDLGDDDEDKEINRIASIKDDDEFLNEIRSLNIVLPQFQEAIIRREKNKGRGSSAAERVLERQYIDGLINKTQYDTKMGELANKLVGGVTESTQKGFDVRAEEKRVKKVADSRKIYAETTAQTRTSISGIDKVLFLLDNGNTDASMKMIAQILSETAQAGSTKAVKMYDDFLAKNGDVLQRIKGKVNEFMTGTQDETQRKLIRDEVTRYKNDFLVPLLGEMSSKQRIVAKSDGLDPFDVVPPTTFKEVKNAWWLTDVERAKAINKYNIKLPGEK